MKINDIKYHTAMSSASIRPVEISRANDRSIWIKGKRRAKISQWDRYHDTWAMAKAHLVKVHTARVTACTIRLQSAQILLNKIHHLAP